MNQLLQANGPFVIAFVIATIIAVAVGLQVQRTMRRASSRHAVLLAAVLLPPVLLAAAALGVRMPLPGSPASTEIEMTAPLDRASPAEAAESGLPSALSIVWLAGALIALARITVEVARWRGVAARAEVITDSALLARIESRCVLARSAECAEPTVIGILDPVIVLPAACDFEPAELDAVFAHELAHVNRRDNLTALAVQIVCALFWFDPLHRLARRKLFELRERVCDELVLDRGCDARAYATALARSTRSTLENHAVACMSRLNLQERMESIMTHNQQRRLPAWITRGLITAVVAAAAIGFATFSPAPVLSAGELSPAASDFDVRVTPYGDGRFALTVRIDSPEGPITSVAVVRSAPDVRIFSTTHGGKTYSVEVNLAADGSAIGRFEVTDSNKEIRAIATKTFAAPEILAKMGAAMLPPAPPKPSGIDKATTRPKVMYRVDPVYPEEAKKNRIAGIVVTEVTVDETGAVSDVRVLKPLPFGLDKSAADAIRQWRFEPTIVDGKPAPVLFNITVNFKTDDEGT